MDSASHTRNRKRRRHQQPISAARAADADPDLSPTESLGSRTGTGPSSSSKRARYYDDAHCSASPPAEEQHDQPVASTSAKAEPTVDDHMRSPGSMSLKQERSPPTAHPRTIFALPPAERGPRAAMRHRDQQALSRNAIHIDDDDDQGGGAALTEEQALIEQLRAELETTRKEVKAKNELIESQRSALTYIHGQASCTICLELAWRPHVLSPCGHIFCARCLVDWFQRPQSPDRGGDGLAIDNDAALAREKICPHCRSFVRGLPAEVWALKGMVEHLDAAQQLGHILLDDGASVAPRTAAEEAHLRGDDLPPGTKLWEPFFEPDGQREPILDESDGVWRCGNCSCEIWKRECTGCGRNHHAFFVSRGIFDDADDDDEDGETEYEWHEDADADASDAGTFTTGNLHGPQSPGPWMDVEHATPHLGIPYDPEEEEDVGDGDGSDLADFIVGEAEEAEEGSSGEESVFSGDGGGGLRARPFARRGGGGQRRYGYSDEEDEDEDEDDEGEVEFSDEYDDDDDDRDDRDDCIEYRVIARQRADADPDRSGSSRRPIQVRDDLDSDSDESCSDSDEGEGRYIGSSSASSSRRKTAAAAGRRRRAVSIEPSDDEEEEEEEHGEEYHSQATAAASDQDDDEDDDDDDVVLAGARSRSASTRQRTGRGRHANRNARVISDDEDDEQDDEEGEEEDE